MAIAETKPPGLSVKAFKKSLILLFTPRFGTYFFATLLSNLGTWAQLIAEPWLLLSLGASSFVIGLDNFALSAPAFVLTLVGGVLADHRDRRRVITLFQTIQMLCPAILIVLLLTDSVSIWVIIALSAVVGITDALSMPAFQSIVPSIVERKQVATGITLNSVQFNLSRILGPALAGVLMASYGAIACFAVNTLSYVPFIAVALWMLPRGKVSLPETKVFDRHALFSGAEIIVRDARFRRPLLIVLASSVFCAPLVTFSPVLIRDAFHEGVGGFSAAVTAFGAGGVLGAVVLLGVDAATHLRLVSILAVAYAVVVVAIGLNPSMSLLPLLLFLGGLSMTASNISANAQLQTVASESLRGQAVSLYMLAMRGGLAVGSLLTGGIIHLLGIRGALVADGVAGIVAQVLVITIGRTKLSRTT